MFTICTSLRSFSINAWLHLSLHFIAYAVALSTSSINFSNFCSLLSCSLNSIHLALNMPLFLSINFGVIIIFIGSFFTLLSYPMILLSIFFAFGVPFNSCILFCCILILPLLVSFSSSTSIKKSLND